MRTFSLNALPVNTRPVKKIKKLGRKISATRIKEIVIQMVVLSRF